MTNTTPEPLKVFCSYSHRNEEHLDELRDWLSPLKKQGLIEWWHDREITPGQEWDEAIDMNLRTADVILLLVTQSFMASDYISEKEISKAVERHNRGEASVIPIIVRPAHWEWASFGKLQALPKNAKPIITWAHQDEAWLDVVRGVEKAVKELLRERQERAAKYRNAVAEAWTDKRLTNAEVERLSALANELELGTNDAADIERDVMDATKEAVPELQKQAAREERRRHIRGYSRTSKGIRNIRTNCVAKSNRERLRTSPR